MGKALRGSSEDGRGGWRAVVRTLIAVLIGVLSAPALPAQDAPERLDRGRFTFLFFPQDRQLAQSLADRSVAGDSFPGLPRPVQRAIIAIAPDRRRFRAWVGESAPEWGSAIAFPESRRIILQGRRAGSDAGDPVAVLRHELAHLALHEHLGNLPTRWFDEGYASYAAGEWGREEVLMTNLALALRGMPTFDELEEWFGRGSNTAQSAYALAYRAVAELATIDRDQGLSLLLRYWRESANFDRAMRRAYGMTVNQFETRWRSRTRRQYGALALVSNVTLAATLMLFVIAPLYVARRRRDRQRLERMRAADAAAEQAQATVIDELLKGPDTPPPTARHDSGG